MSKTAALKRACRGEIRGGLCLFSRSYFFSARKRAKKTVSASCHRTRAAAQLAAHPASGRGAQAGTYVPVRLVSEADGAARHLPAAPRSPCGCRRKEGFAISTPSHFFSARKHAKKTVSASCHRMRAATQLAAPPASGREQAGTPCPSASYSRRMALRATCPPGAMRPAARARQAARPLQHTHFPLAPLPRLFRYSLGVIPVLSINTARKYTLELNPTSAAVSSTDFPLSISGSDRSILSPFR